jgi:3-hydroxyacyl-[acyl-carrier-protein] dehydratase
MIEPDNWPTNLEGRPNLLTELLPHRPPMLLVDELVGWDGEREFIVGRRAISEGHLGLDGHFPDGPVLPGTLLLEMLGQVGVALFRLLLTDEFEGEPFQVRATKILGAHFTAEVRPGDEVDLVVRARGYDTFLGECEAQALVDGQVVAAMAGEVAIV